MNKSELIKGISALASDSNIRFSDEFKQQDNAKMLLNYILVQLSYKTGISIDVLLEDYANEVDTEIDRLNAELKRKDEKIAELQAELASKETKVNKPTTLGYGTAFTEDVYEELDRLIAFGYNNRIIADKLGIHRNTVMNRRRKIQNNMK